MHSALQSDARRSFSIQRADKISARKHGWKRGKKEQQMDSEEKCALQLGTILRYQYSGCQLHGFVMRSTTMSGNN